MTCEQIRETVDAVNLSEAAARHLNTCGTCRKETAATAHLVALLQTQPKVKAPVDFMAQLQMRMMTETVSENARLRSLLQSIPAVTAPPDFAFRVRTRLAQTKVEETASNPLVWLQNWFANSFTFGQAATAMAAIALIAVFTTAQLRNGSSATTTPPNAFVAQVEVENVPALPAAASVSAEKTMPVAFKAKPSTRSGFAPTAVKAPAAIASKAEMVVARALPSESVEPAMYSPKSRQEVRISNGNAYGQQLAKMMKAQRDDSLIAAF